MESPSGAPADANDGCVAGTEAAGKADSCAGCPNQSACATGTAAVPDPKKAQDAAAVASSLASVGRIILVLSGKGGVGKSTVSTQFAWTLAAHYGFSVGLLDVDICGPSAPRMCGVARSAVRRGPDGRWTPVYAHENLAVMSVGFLTPNEDDAIVWRGPRKEGMIRQFLSEVNWCADGEILDYLVVDTPPGTSDEHMSIVNHLVRGRGVDGAVVVTTSEEVSMADVRKELNFCTKVGVRVIGVVENMASMTMGFGDVAFHRAPVRLTPMEADPLSPTKAVSPALGGTFSNDSTDDAATDTACDGAGEECTQEVLDLIRTKCPQLLTDYLITTDVFRLQKKNNDINTPKGMAAKFNVPYLGGISLDRNLLECCEKGVPLVETFPHSPAVAGLMRLVDQVLEQCPPVDDEEEIEEDMYM